ncbi:MAG: hypothetical protein ACYTER_11160, partial [Planctomycetota bacterium]
MRNIDKRKYEVAILLVLMLVVCSVNVWAGVEEAGEPAAKISMWSTIASGRLVGVVIMIISLVAAALIIENFMSIRRSKLVPEELAGELAEQIEASDYDKAIETGNEDDSFLGVVIASGLARRDSAFGFFEM